MTPGGLTGEVRGDDHDHARGTVGDHAARDDIPALHHYCLDGESLSVKRGAHLGRPPGWVSLARERDGGSPRAAW